MSTFVAYYSRSGQNYVAGSIKELKIGNAQILAEFAAKAAGADLFQIETVRPYPVDYRECCAQAAAEKEAGARPELVEAGDVSAYDTVVLIYPNWCGTMPMAVYAFLEAHDFAGITILPICTHEGSGMSGTEQDIARCCPGATVGKGLAIKGHEAAQSEGKVRSWLEDAGVC